MPEVVGLKMRGAAVHDLDETTILVLESLKVHLILILDQQLAIVDSRELVRLVSSYLSFGRRHRTAGAAVIISVVPSGVEEGMKSFETLTVVLRE